MKNEEIEMKPAEKLLYIHIPKTGGTSIANFFKKHFDPDSVISELHADQTWVNEGDIPEHIKYIGGHTSFAEFNQKIDLSKWLVVTCIRNPLAQLVSHLLHFKRLNEVENRELFNGCSEEIKQIILRVAGIDLNSADSICTFYNTISNQELMQFDNIQTRCLTSGFALNENGQRITFQELEYALRNLQKINVVGEQNNLQCFFNVVTKRMDWQAAADIPFDNVATEKYGFDLNNPAIVNALWPFIRYDMALYSQRESFLCKSSELIDGRKD